MPLELRFNCDNNNDDFLTIESEPNSEKIEVRGMYNEKPVIFYFDIPTAIKLQKTIRTNINNVKSGSDGK